MKESNLEVVLLSELRGIRHLMEDFLRNSSSMINQRGTSGVHYPPVEPVTDYRPAMVPRERAPPPEPNRILYQNVVDTIKEVMDRRSPSQREQQLKPSDISSKYKYAFKRQPPSPPSNNQAKLATLQRPSQTSSPSIKPSSTISSSNAPVSKYILNLCYFVFFCRYLLFVFDLSLHLHMKLSLIFLRLDH